MSLASAVKGAMRPSQQITWTREDGEVESLTGAILTGFIRNETTKAVRAITGNLEVLDTPGVFRWDYSAEDVSAAGTFGVQFVAEFESDQTPAKTFITYWRVLPSIAT